MNCKAAKPSTVFIDKEILADEDELDTIFSDIVSSKYTSLCVNDSKECTDTIIFPVQFSLILLNSSGSIFSDVFIGPIHLTKSYDFVSSIFLGTLA